MLLVIKTSPYWPDPNPTTPGRCPYLVHINIDKEVAITSWSGTCTLCKNLIAPLYSTPTVSLTAFWFSVWLIMCRKVYNDCEYCTYVKLWGRSYPLDVTWKICWIFCLWMILKEIITMNPSKRVLIWHCLLILYIIIVIEIIYFHCLVLYFIKPITKYCYTTSEYIFSWSAFSGRHLYLSE